KYNFIKYKEILSENGINSFNDIKYIKNIKQLNELLDELNMKSILKNKFMGIIEPYLSFKINNINKINNKKEYYISNPFILLLGCSNYDGNSFKNLPATKQTIKNMEYLFKNIYKYKHVYTNLDELNINNK